jgi:spore coat polysaccharide biosynthesis protein SpsF
MGSKRLPDKSLMKIEGKPMVAHLIDRARLSKLVPTVILAIPDSPQDDPLEDFAKSYPVPYFRASEDDVLKRYIDTAEHFGIETIVRLTGDNPLIEASYIDDALNLHFREKADLTVGKNEDEIPLGFGNEVVSLSALKIADKEGYEPNDREHVTWYILRPENRNRFKIVFLKGKKGLKNKKIRLTIDTSEDFKLMEQLFKRLYGKNKLFGLKEVLEVYKKEPKLFDINLEIEHSKDLYHK